MHLPHVDLVAKLNRSHDRPHYDVFAGTQLVGVIYLMHVTGASETWRWSMNTVCMDGTVPHVLKGYEASFEKARADFRKAFDVWLAWAIAVKPWDLKRPEIDRNLKAIGVERSGNSSGTLGPGKVP